jgi:hypothetical protein
MELDALAGAAGLRRPPDGRVGPKVVWLPLATFGKGRVLTTRTAVFCGLAILAAATAARAQSPLVLACKLPAAKAPAPPAERIFRVAPGSFQEWDPVQRRFGPNLCAAYACSKSAERLEGVIGSASVSYTVGVVPSTREAYWRVNGASGLAADHGPCRVTAEPKP